MSSSKATSSSGRRREEQESIGRFQRLEQIGKGSFALVYKGVHVRRRAIVAIKSVHLSKLNKKLKDNLVSEIKILQSLHHPHIVALIDCIERETMMHLVMEYCEIGDLSMFIKSHLKLVNDPVTAGMFQKYPSNPVGGFNEVIVRHFMKQIASAMEFIRAKNFVHRDIKPQNLLLNPSPLYYARQKPEIMPYQVDENSLVPATGVETLPMLKIADFGFARFLAKTSLAETLCGSPLYMAPEILRYEKYDAKADLWSIGTVLYEMMFAKAPFRAGNHVELLRKIEKQNDVIRFSSSVQMSGDIKNLIEALLKKSPTERIGFNRFFDHQVIKGAIPGLVGEDRQSESRSDLLGSSRRQQRQPAQSHEQFQDADAQEQELHYYSQTRTAATPPGRSPRPSTGNERATTSPAVADAHRQPSRSPPTDQGGRVQRRPAISSHATAPARPSQTQDRAAAAALGQPERRPSKKQTSPRTSMLKEQLERERVARVAEDRASREVSEQAAQDVAFERDYVVVEKRAVEVNAFADDLANAPQVHGRVASHPQSTAMTRRATTQAIPSVGQNTSRAIQTVSTSAKQRPDIMHQRTGSYERRYGRSSPTSAASVIAKALKEANLRVFGSSVSPPSLKGVSPPKGYGAFPAYPISHTDLTFVGDRALEAKDDDMRMVYIVEELATRSDVVFGYADIKYRQLLPTPPSHGQGLGIATVGSPYELRADLDDDDFPLGAVVAISEEVLVLYIKTLAILTRAIGIAGNWWNIKQRGETSQLDSTTVARISPTTGSRTANLSTATHRMNNVVQWCRDRYNDCLERSEFVTRKLSAAQRSLPVDHPSHPSNHPIVASTGSSSANSIGTSAEAIPLTTGVTAEKLLYDRAVEMSQKAAKQDLLGEDLPRCEIDYMTAVRMLEAILEDSNEPVAAAASLSRKESSTSGGGKKDGNEDGDELIHGLEMKDRQVIMKIVGSLRQRIAAVRGKMELQRASKRSSTGAGG